MDPVDPGAAQRSVNGAVATQYQQRNPIAPGVEDGHACVLQADVGVHQHRHMLAAGLVIPVCYGHGDFFVAAHQDSRNFGGRMMYQRVMNAAE